MSDLNLERYKILVARLNACIALLAPRLTSEAIEHVRHYIDHGELELAYESLVLSCIRELPAREMHISEELQTIGSDLNMEHESVFEADFWKIAQEYFTTANTNIAPLPQKSQ